MQNDSRWTAPDGKKTPCRDADSRQSDGNETVVFSSSAQSIVVSKPVLKEENGMTVLSAEVSGAVSGACFFSTETTNREFVDGTSSNCFLIGLLFTAMYAGCDLVLEGAVSEKLLFETRHYLIPTLIGFFDKQLKPIKIRAAQLLSGGCPDADAVGTGLSGGIDSLHTIREFYLDFDGPPADRVNTLLFFNVGSHGMGHDREHLARLERKFMERRRALEGYSKSIGLPLVIVNSNIHAFMQSGHLQTCTLASLSAALFLAGKMRLYYMASTGHTYRGLIYPSVKSTSIARIDDYILPHVCTETFTAVSGGSACSRVQKTLAICSDPLVQKYLNVCNDHNTIAKNCSMCYKCQRTLLTLDILGVIDRFSESFDLGKFNRRERARYIATVLNNRKKDPLLQDICNLAEERHYDLRSKTSIFLRLYMRFTETKLFSALRSVLRRK
jgi:hypothetical protein